MLIKSVKSVISVVLKHVTRAKESVQSVRSVSYNIRKVSPGRNNFEYPMLRGASVCKQVLEHSQRLEFGKVWHVQPVVKVDILEQA